MLDFLHVEFWADLLTRTEAVVLVWGPLLIFVFMTIESSLFPFPSEVVMIPAGFIIARHTAETCWWSEPVALGFLIVVGLGLLGSMVGAYFNYYLALWLGRPILHKYGRYFFLSAHKLDRAEEIFRHHGEIATFVCRLLPAIRQLISLPAGLSKMNVFRFSLFTALGAGFWVIVLTVIGYVLGHAAGDMTYLELCEKGEAVVKANFVWVLLGLVVLIAVYIWVHKKIMGPVIPPEPEHPAEQ